VSHILLLFLRMKVALTGAQLMEIFYHQEYEAVKSPKQFILVASITFSEDFTSNRHGGHIPRQTVIQESYACMNRRVLEELFEAQTLTMQESLETPGIYWFKKIYFFKGQAFTLMISIPRNSFPAFGSERLRSADKNMDNLERSLLSLKEALKE
ncbi:hypothetical protein RYX36_035611, partial [Vicia faba]